VLCVHSGLRAFVLSFMYVLKPEKRRSWLKQWCLQCVGCLVSHELHVRHKISTSFDLMDHCLYRSSIFWACQSKEGQWSDRKMMLYNHVITYEWCSSFRLLEVWQFDCFRQAIIILDKIPEPEWQMTDVYYQGLPKLRVSGPKGRPSQIIMLPACGPGVNLEKASKNLCTQKPHRDIKWKHAPCCQPARFQVFAFYVQQYGPRVNLFVDHSQIIQVRRH